MPDENLDKPIPAGRPQRPVYQAPPTRTPDLPGARTLIFWGGIGCLAFVIVFGGLAAVGVALFVAIAQRLPPPRPVAEHAPKSVARAKSEEVDWKPGDKLPEPPLKLPIPRTPESRIGTRDLSTLGAGELLRAAELFYRRGRYQEALQCQFQFVMKTNNGRYNLACFYARAGNVEAALYWLQACARDEMSDADWTSKDEDLVRVRADPRWPELLRYLRIQQRYWETVPK